MRGGGSLRETLAELHEELRLLEAQRARGEGVELPADARDSLREAAREIERALGALQERGNGGAGEARGAEDADSLRRRLQEAIGRFEESHPTLTAVVGRVIDALSDLGI
jgi:Domain of unknown function (DUF4404)